MLVTRESVAEAGLRWMEYGPKVWTDADGGRYGHAVIDGQTGNEITDLSIASISVSIAGDGPKASVMLDIFDEAGLPVTPDKLLDRSAILPYHFLVIGDVVMPIENVSCADRIHKVTATFTHMRSSFVRDDLGLPTDERQWVPFE